MNIHILRRTLYFNYCKLFLTKTLVSLIKVQESKVSVMSPSGDQSPCHSDKEITAFQDQAKQKQKSYKQAAKENFQCSANCPLNIQQLDEQLVHIHCTKCILTNNNVNKVLQTHLPFIIMPSTAVTSSDIYYSPSVLANPKSHNFTTPDLDTKIFSGFTSLWII